MAAGFVVTNHSGDNNPEVMVTIQVLADPGFEVADLQPALKALTDAYAKAADELTRRIVAGL